jgi:uncharacterized LabA/DUF88 family protein
VAFAFSGDGVRTIGYVDGFNLYYRALKGTPYKWLDLNKMLSRILKKENRLVGIRYFTAMVTGRIDPDQPRRQRTYLNALETLPGLTVHLGTFLAKSTKRPLSGSNPRQFVSIDSFEEKGSDVNLASYLVHDGWRDMYDVAVVVTSDTDLITPIELVIRDLKKPVGIISPSIPCPKGLAQVASFVRHIRKADLKNCQFPASFTNAQGKRITQPRGW